MPTQMPSSGVPALRRRGRSRRATGSSSALVAAKWPTPGTMTARRAVAVRRALPASMKSAPSADERLAHRRQVAGAVVDERDHSSPFVLGSIFASRASFAQATRSARANALNTAST